jgi:hypothetical protein
MSHDPNPLDNYGISAKLEVKTELPSFSSGRTLDAITDLLRPFSEGLGLIGDKIQLRRQKTLLEIAKRARERINILQKPIQPIPQKFFMPLLEKASLEDVSDDTLVSMWANLIATASTEPVQMLGQYINILSNIVPGQVLILKHMFDHGEGVVGYGHLLDNYYLLNQTGLPGSLNEHAALTDAEEFADAIIDNLNIKGVAIDTINIYYVDESLGDGFSICAPDGIYSDEKYLDFENLVRLGLIDRTEIKKHSIGIFDIDVHYYIANPVGIDLFACCNPKRLPREH